MGERVAVLVDSGFVRKKLAQAGKAPDAKSVVGLTNQIMKKPRLMNAALLRIYFHDALPFTGTAKNPLDGSVTAFATTAQAKAGNALLDALELQPDFAVRRGALMCTGWKMGKAVMRSLVEAPPNTPRTPSARDLVPDLSQKGVDLRIGLDIALMSLKRLVEIIVLVTGDSDLVPAMKFPCNEGVRVYLDAMGHPVRRELKAHADFVL